MPSSMKEGIDEGYSCFISNLEWLNSHFLNSRVLYVRFIYIKRGITVIFVPDV